MTSQGRGEAGANATEYVGILVCAALVITGVLLCVAPKQLGAAVRQAICTIMHAGDSRQCVVVDTRVPTEPCPLSSEGGNASFGLTIAVVDVGMDLTLITEQMSDGTYRVTKSQSLSGGASVGVGYTATVTVNDSRWGASIAADAGVGGKGSSSETYVVLSKEAAESVRDQIILEASSNLAAGPMAGSAARWAYNQVSGATPRTPSSVTVSGELAASATASNDIGVMGAKGTVDVGTVLAHTTNSDGSTTIAYGVTGTAEVTASAMTESVKVGGEGSAILTEDRDPQGNVVGASIVQSVPAGDTQRVTTYYLPVRTDADRAAVAQVEWDPSAPWTAFPEYVKKHGQASVVDYSDNGTQVGAVFDIETLAKVGLQGGGGTIKRRVEAASYWDGTSWQTWSGCKR